MKDTNVSYYMRRQLNLSQYQVAKKTGLTANDISRLERGIRRHRIEKLMILSDFFNIPIDALINNNLKAALLTFKKPMKVSRKLKEQIKVLQEKRDEIGNKGEDWVFQKESEKLVGTIYENAINPNYSEDPEACFDILSFNSDGRPLRIEVKTTTGDAEDPFFITSDELKKAKQCYENRLLYEVHRVYKINKPSQCGRVIIPASTLLTNYEFIPETYKVKRKDR